MREESDEAEILAAIDALPDGWGLVQHQDGLYVAVSWKTGRETLGSRSASLTAAHAVYVAENEALGLFAPVRQVPVQTRLDLDVGAAAQSHDGLLPVKLKRKKGQSKALKRYAKDKKKHWRS